MANLPWYYWLVALVLLASAWWFKKRADEVGQTRRRSDVDVAASEGLAATSRSSPAEVAGTSSKAASMGGTELVAVIAAAVAAASGLHPSQFRIAGFSAVGSSGSARGAEGVGGWNTPVWGRVERFARPENHR